MPILLKNNYLNLEINEPGMEYRGTRFDWTGQIVQITYLNKHTFCTSEKLNEPSNKNQGQGLYNEFGIDMPVGYDECRTGEKFPKIGVGKLTKESDSRYDFFYHYPLEPYSFTHTVKTSEVSFSCKSHSNDDYAFHLEKTVQLDEDSFSIHYSLLNTGKKEIRTNEYVHNFLAINNKPVDEKYQLYFPFRLIPEKFGFSLNPGNVVQFGDRWFTWKAVPDAPFFFSKLNADYHGLGTWSLSHKEEKVGVSESTNFKFQKINLWGASHVISPEIFAPVTVSPGKKLSWVRQYQFFTFE